MNSIEINNEIKNGKKINVFDIRKKNRYDIFHIDGSINVKKGELISNPSKFMNKQDTYYVTCNSGNSALLVKNILELEGYQIHIIENGMVDLISKNLQENK